MLRLENITKDYPLSGETIHALRGVSMELRDSEFVSVLGPSGCGKTTLLNIIGGLDRYTDGDLIIDGRSTKTYKDRDWDNYRNHSVGFVFQSYNLIPHQSVLQNVELALTLSGISKKERKRRAKEALVKVGLGDQFKKKPSEISGGQMQRVAIARAIVNDPEIILADEPTGALDSETSTQVMDILKEISDDRLVVMVTHNSELAEKYSTRIINMKDGVITGDSKPITEDEKIKTEDVNKSAETKKKPKGKKRASMSLPTSFSLSLRNLFTKKGRTFLTAFAGSIGIIGIALIYSVSYGMTAYINDVQEDTLSSYPLTIESEYMDFTAMLQSFMGSAGSVSDHENDAVYKRTAIFDILDALNSENEKKNDLRAFKEYVEKERENPDSEFGQAITAVQYTYNFDLQIYTESVDGKIIVSDTQKLLQELMLSEMNIDMSGMMNLRDSTMGGSSGSMFMSQGSVLWEELLPGDNSSLVNPIVEKQYELVYGQWPNSYEDIMLVLDEKNEVPDMALYALGLVHEDEVKDILKAVTDGTPVEHKSENWSYKEICEGDYRTVIGSDCYVLDEEKGLYNDLRNTDAGLEYLYDNGLKLNVCGIIKPKEDVSSAMLNGSMVYTSALTDHIISKTDEADVVKAQLENKDKDVVTGLRFKQTGTSLTDAEKAEYFKDYAAGLSDNEKAELYAKMLALPSEDEINEYSSSVLSSKSREEKESDLLTVMTGQMGLGESEARSYLSDMSDEKIDGTYSDVLAEQYKMQYAQAAMEKISGMTPEMLLLGFENEINGLTEKRGAECYDGVLTFSDSTYEDNLKEFGYCDIDDPSTVNLYTDTFEKKDTITSGISSYNDSVDEEQKISYTDYVQLIMSSVTTIINAITYVLIAFVAVSLIVSSIMVGVITLISVQERTKEIGILRAMGASKRNVSSLFNAETVLIGFFSGLIGVGATYLLCILINLILHRLTGIQNLNAFLPVQTAVILIIISVVLTMIAGIIPSRSAAKKDPVIALRTE